MERLTQKLTQAGVAGIDTPVLIYHFEAHPVYAPVTQILFSSLEAGKWKGFTSTITLMEISVHPWQAGRGDIARKYEALLVNFPNLTIVDIDRNIARLAAQLRARFNVRPADALQVAASLSVGAKLFLTNDHRLAALNAVIEIALLDDFISE